MTVGIYCFTNTLNGKQYIGQSMNIEKRYKEHKNRHLKVTSTMYNTSFYQALRKYGFENFNFKIIDSNDTYTRENLNTLEKYYIKKYNTYNNGYNMNYGGDTIYVSHKLSETQVLQIKELLKQGKSNVEIASLFYISDSLVPQINKGTIWKEIGVYEYPIRIESYKLNKGGNNPNAVLTNEDVIQMRLRYVKETLPEIYNDYKDKVSFSAVKKVLYGVQFKSLPIYKKREKAWYLNGTCIDYPRIEE